MPLMLALPAVLWCVPMALAAVLSGDILGAAPLITAAILSVSCAVDELVTIYRKAKEEE